jgi:imidazolonepropionase-like amidohydrolase
MNHASRYLCLMFFMTTTTAFSQKEIVLQADRVFDGEEMHTDWTVKVIDNRIVEVGPTSSIKYSSDATILKFDKCTIMPGMIEGHGHLFLRPYNEMDWNDQVLKESDVLRTVRATTHAFKTLKAGFTTFRDLGTEGAGYADVGLKQAIDQGIISGPRMIVAGRAIVATGSYGPNGYDTDSNLMLGAEPADGNDLIRVVRDQIGKGAEIIKVYADYRWGLKSLPQPTFSIEELKLIVETAKSSGRPVVAHATTAEGMRRATLAGVETIEHGDGGTAEVFALMKQKGVALCPTVAAGHAVSQYKGWKPGTLPEPARVQLKKETFKLAIKSGVTICAGGDVGVFAHGDNARELEMMVDYGMNPLDVLRTVTSVNAKIFHQDELGRITAGRLADIIVVRGDPSHQISNLRNIELVMKDGKVIPK